MDEYNDNDSVVDRFFAAVDSIINSDNDDDDTVDIPEGFFEAVEVMSTTTTTAPTIGGLKGTTPWTGGKPDKGWTKSENTRPKTPNSILPTT